MSIHECDQEKHIRQERGYAVEDKYYFTIVST